jgi:hypothetical protein
MPDDTLTRKDPSIESVLMPKKETIQNDNCLCSVCNDAGTPSCPKDNIEIDKYRLEGHSFHCAIRLVWGDGECECGKSTKEGGDVYVNKGNALDSEGKPEDLPLNPNNCENCQRLQQALDNLSRQFAEIHTQNISLSNSLEQALERLKEAGLI